MRAQKLVVATVWMAAVAWPGFGQSRPAAGLRVSVYMDYQGAVDLRGANLSKAIASRWSELPIAREDVDLVHAGIEKRAQLGAAHTLQNSLAGNLAPTLVAAFQPQ